MVKYLFRMDDICPTMDVEKFAAFENIFKKNDIKPLIGIVPDNQDSKLKPNDENPEFWDQMRSLVLKEYWEIAQHGYQHIYHTEDGGILNLNSKSETSGFSYDVQLELLTKGYNILKKQGLDTDIYMAPSHSYDQNTLKALKELNFKYVTDGYSFFPYKYKDLVFVPCQMAHPRKMPFGIFTFCIHSNTADWNLINKYNDFIEDNIDKIVSFEQVKGIIKNTTINIATEKCILGARKTIKNIGGLLNGRRQSS